MLIIFAQILCAANEQQKCSTLTRATIERYAPCASGSRARKRTLTRASSKAKKHFLFLGRFQPRYRIFSLLP